jgi:seryl-tRNA synthetase
MAKEKTTADRLVETQDELEKAQERIKTLEDEQYTLNRDIRGIIFPESNWKSHDEIVEGVRQLNKDLQHAGTAEKATVKALEAELERVWNLVHRLIEPASKERLNINACDFEDRPLRKI